MHQLAVRSHTHPTPHVAFLILVMLLGTLLPSRPVQAAPALEPAAGRDVTVPAPAAAPVELGPPAPPEPRPPLRRPALAVQVAVTPTIAAPGAVVTYTVRLVNAGEGLVHGVALSGTLPGGLECPDCAGFYSPGNRRLFWTWGSLAAGTAVTVTFSAQVTAAAAWEEGIALALGAGGVEAPRESRGRAVVRVPYPRSDGRTQEVLQPGVGGRLVSADGRLTVTVPAEAVGVSLTVVYSPTEEVEGRDMRWLRQFQLRAYDAAGREVHAFAAPVEIVYRYTWAEAQGHDAGALTLARREETGAWRWLPTEVDPERWLVRGRTEHFSDFGVEEEHIKLPSDDYTPPMQGFQEIDLYSGAASYSYPLAAAAGRGGFAPQLTLSYNSGSVDWPAAAWDPDTQASWVGYGWSLEVGAINRQNVGGWDWTGTVTNCEAANPYTDTGDVYSLSLNGAGHDLVLGTDGYYHTAAETYWQVEEVDAAEFTNWQVRTTDGTVYSFTQQLRQVRCRTSGCDWQEDGAYEVYRWLLTAAEDTHGNRIDYLYATQDVTCTVNRVDHVCQEAAYLSEVRYNYDDSTPPVAQARVKFTLATREDDDDAPANGSRCPSEFKQLKRLASIQVQVWTGPYYEGVREYRLTHDYTTLADNSADPGDGKLTLTGIQECTSPGINQYCLPATTLSYWTWDNLPLPPPAGWNRLQRVANGYGGAVTFDYEVSEIHDSRKRVVEREVEDGLGNTATWTYGYSAAQRNLPKIAGTACQYVSEDAGSRDPQQVTGPRTRVGQEFRGHARVTVTNPLGEVQVHEYDQGDTWRGKETWAAYYDGAGNLYREVLTTYADLTGTVVTPTYTYAEPELAFSYVYTQAERLCNGEDACVEAETRSYYEAACQGNGQYGNLTRVEEYGAGTTPYRTTVKKYVPNTTAWIVGLVGSEAVFTGTATCASTSGWARWTSYAYDGGDPGAAPEVGDLTRVIEVLEYPTQTVQVRYTHDDYGNRTSETSYREYGSCMVGGSCPLPAQPLTTTLGYDVSGQGYFLYPERVTYTNGFTESADYDYRFGVVTRYTDVNGVGTSYTYDPFGRVDTVIRAGDTAVTPTVVYGYHDYGSTALTPTVPFMREVWRKGPADGEPWTADGTWERRFYDGLGRLVQTHTPYQDWYGFCFGCGHEVVTAAQYDALGQQVAVTVPYTKTAYVYDPDCEGTGLICNPYVEPDWEQPQTYYAYDPLGRTVAMTHTDGTTVTTFFHERRVAVVDEAHHLAMNESDAFGRLVAVREYTGTYDFRSNPQWTAPAYATTVYSYTARDALWGVEDDLGNETILSYDALGRKVGMVDPDMGAWSYTYDPRGLLVRQGDARGKWSCLGYDDRGRLVTKKYREDENCPGQGAEGLVVSYTYDDTSGDNYGRGRRTGMQDPSGNTAWAYDARGRVSVERREITGTGALTGTYVTRWGYDSMDRATWMDYPGGDGGEIGERVVTTYNVMNVPESVYRLPDFQGVEYYVKHIDYDVAGRLERRWLGNEVLRTDYSYYSWTTENGRGRLAALTAGTPRDITALQDLRYEYGPTGSVLAIADYQAGTAQDPQVQEFAYDELERLVSAVASGGEVSGTYGLEEYDYGETGNLLEKAGVEYGYEDAAHAHAVTHLDDERRYWYDENGNQVTRVVGGYTYTLEYDAESRLVKVRKNQGVVAQFAYDGDGARVWGQVGATTTLYLGNYYEAQRVGETTTVRQYYYAGGQRVALREGETLYLLLADHLGSQAITADGTTGAKVAEVRYKAWGEDRYASGVTPTTYRYTGQRNESYINLYYYGARWYDQSLGRFIQPDTIIPQQSDPQQLNRFSYTRNNPVRYSDPTGHYMEAGTGFQNDSEDYSFYDPNYFYSPQDAEQAFGVREAMRVPMRAAVDSGKICPVAVGLRLEFSAQIPNSPAYVDVNLDVVYFARSGELGAFATIGFQAQLPYERDPTVGALPSAGGGAGFTLGPLVAENMPNRAAYAGAAHAYGVMGSVGPYGFEGDVSYSDSPNVDGTVPTTYYGGVGAASQFGIYGTRAYTIDIGKTLFGR